MSPEKDNALPLPSLGQYRYKLIKRLDRTRMSEVWLAIELDTGKLVVVKLALIGNFSTANQRAISTEARILPRLEHECLIQLHPIVRERSRSQSTIYQAQATGFPHDENPWFIVMDYLEGGSLRQFLSKQAPLNLRLALQIAKKIADTLVYLHANGILHSDIKTSNIVFGTAPVADDVERPFTLYVIDFGIAIELQATQAQFVIPQGSNPWWAPEAELAKKEQREIPADPSWDIYGLALILQSMLTGQNPSKNTKKRYTGFTLTPEQIPDHIEKAEHDEVEKRINLLLQRSVDAIPADRPNASKFVTELNRILALLPHVQPKGESMNVQNETNAPPFFRQPRFVSIATTVLTALFITASLWAIGPRKIFTRLADIVDTPPSVSASDPLPLRLPTASDEVQPEEATVVPTVDAVAIIGPSVTTTVMITTTKPVTVSPPSSLTQVPPQLAANITPIGEMEPTQTPTARKIPATATPLPTATRSSSGPATATSAPTVTPTNTPTATPTATSLTPPASNPVVVNPTPPGEIAQPITKAEGAEQDHGCVSDGEMRDTWSRVRGDRTIITDWRWTQDPPRGRYQIGVAVSQDDLRNLNAYLVGDPVTQPKATINALQAYEIFEANGAYNNGKFNANSDHYWGIFYINGAGKPISLLSPACRFKFGGG